MGTRGGTSWGNSQESAREKTDGGNRTAPKDRQKTKGEGSPTDRQTAAGSLTEGLGERNPGENDRGSKPQDVRRGAQQPRREPDQRV